MVTHDGQSLVVYCYDENDNPVEIDSFPAYEIIVSDSDVEVNLVDG